MLTVGSLGTVWLSISVRAERYSSSRRVTPASSKTRRTARDGRRISNDQPLLCGGEVGVHQRGQPGRVHERHLGQVDLDGVALAAQPVQHLDQLGGGGDVQLTVHDEQPIAAQVGDLRDLPARGASSCS